MKILHLILLLTIPLSAIQLKTGLLYTGWPEKDSTLNGAIEIVADADATTERHPIQVIYLIDVSRECAGTVRQGLIDGGKELVNTLRDNDRFGIVVYSKFTRTLMPLTNLTAESRKEAFDQLDRITTEEGRDIASALNKVASEFKLRAGEKIDGRYLVITSLASITDGKKKKGLIPELKLSESTDSIGCITHTVNYGESFDEQNAIYAAEQSQGRAYFAPKDRPDSLLSIFRDLSVAIYSPLYRDLELFVEIPETEMKLCRFGTTEPLPNPIKIKQISRGKTERIPFTIQNKPTQTSSMIDFDLDYYDVATKTRINLKDNLKISLLKEPIYNPEFAGTLIRASILNNLAEDITMLRRLDAELGDQKAKEFRRNYAFTFQQQVVNRLESIKSSIGTPEMDKTVAVMQKIFEEIRDGVYGNEHLIRSVQFDLHQTLHGR